MSVATAQPAISDPPRDCSLCPRLSSFIADWRLREQDWHNAPVPTFLPDTGAETVRALIVGLAPGLRGANRTGRPFTGDYAGSLLYETMVRFNFARGFFEARPDDSLKLIDAAVTNAVRCVPPQNKPTGREVNTCRESFLVPTLANFPNLTAIITLGRIAHESTVRALGFPARALPFSHGAQQDAGPIRIFSSYHCSRYNTNTGVLTPEMFTDVFASARAYLDRP